MSYSATHPIGIPAEHASNKIAPVIKICNGHIHIVDIKKNNKMMKNVKQIVMCFIDHI